MASQTLWSRARVTGRAPADAEDHKLAGLSAAEARAAAIDLRDVTAGYRDHAALETVTMTVPAGSMMAIVGPNGGGKSTLLKVLLGLLAPWHGTVRVLGTEPAPARGRIGYVP